MSRDNQLQKEMQELNGLLLRYKEAYKTQKPLIKAYTTEGNNLDAERERNAYKRFQKNTDKKIGEKVDNFGPLKENANDKALVKKTKEHLRDQAKDKLKVDKWSGYVVDLLKKVAKYKDPELFNKAKEKFKKLSQTVEARAKHSETKDLGALNLVQEVTATAEAIAKTKITFDSLYDGFKVLVQAGVLAEATWKLQSEYENILGKFSFALETEARTLAKVQGELKLLDLKKLNLASIEYEAAAKAEAKVTASAKYHKALPIGDIDASLEATLLAKAEGKVGGTLKVGAKGVELKIGGQAMVFAGAEAGGEFTYKTKKGQTILRLRGNIAAGVGAGVSFGGKVKLENGRLTIAVQCGAAAGAGGSIDFEFELDFKVLGKIILDELRKLIDRVLGIGKKRVARLLEQADNIEKRPSLFANWPDKTAQILKQNRQRLLELKADIDQNIKPEKLPKTLKTIRADYETALAALAQAYAALQAQLKEPQITEYLAYTKTLGPKWAKIALGKPLKKTRKNQDQANPKTEQPSQEEALEDKTLEEAELETE